MVREGKLHALPASSRFRGKTTIAERSIRLQAQPENVDNLRSSGESWIVVDNFDLSTDIHNPHVREMRTVFPMKNKNGRPPA